eukprot:TRINITY_DN470_c0_g1_i1.p1 TRINITY_DN470_c0_g1~~TRINITY_DN470_c0_g1_i1.p1  ORF type:complete len:181 (+),score=49.51 TRINITY_DN470_c0_g1_i1:96-638(+)
MDEEELVMAGRQLLSASMRGNMSLLKRVIADYPEIDPNPVDGLLNCPLHYAATGDHLEIAQYLFDKFPQTINPNLQNLAGDTAMHKAIERDNLDFLKLLVEHGASTTLKNKRGRDPAQSTQSDEARQILKSASIATQVLQNQKTVEKAQQNPQVKSTGPLPVVKAELDPSMVADADDNDD